jgi:uncharacterized membrane protein YeaQ/YmgE (transglycosylase-associated protein family)
VLSTTAGESVPKPSLIACIFVGVLLGWFSTGITKGRGVGLLVSVIVGVTSAIVGAWFLPDFGLALGLGEIARAYPIAATLIEAALMSSFALWLLRFVKKP